MRTARALAIYSVVTVALTWPFAANLRVMDAGDSAFFAWEIGWTVHAIKTDPASLPHANIFHPLRYTLGMDEPVLGTTLLVLPLAVFTDDAVLLYNVVRLLTFVFSALTAFWLAKELGAGEWIALLAGALFAFSPIHTDQVAHLSTLGTQWWPLVLLFTIPVNVVMAQELVPGQTGTVSALMMGFAWGTAGLLFVPAVGQIGDVFSLHWVLFALLVFPLIGFWSTRLLPDRPVASGLT